MSACAPLNSIVRTHKSSGQGARALSLLVQAAHSRMQFVQVGGATGVWSAASVERAPEINRRSGVGGGSLRITASASARAVTIQAVKVSGVAPLRCRRHPAFQLREAPLRSSVTDGREAPEIKCQGTESASETSDVCVLTARSSGRVRDKVPSSYIRGRAAQLNR
jgi:hypothetical protein